MQRETSNKPPRRSRNLYWRLTGLIGLLVLAILGIAIHTATILKNRQSDAAVIDLAGRQRMLLERHLKEILLISEGMDAQYTDTRQILLQTLDALIHGGPALARIGGTDTVLLPPAPTEEIRARFLEQRQALHRLISTTDAFLRLSRSSAVYIPARDELLRENQSLQELANVGVTLLDRHSESKIAQMIRWEIMVALIIGLAGGLLAWQLVRATNRLEAETVERLRAEEDLRKSEASTLEALRQSDAMKSALLSSVSHELRTPLTAIKTMVFGLFSDGRMTSQVRSEFIESINQEIDYLNRLIDNLLDMSRIEAGTLVPQREWHLLEELIEGAIRRVGKGLKHRPLQVNLPANLPPIYVDGVGVQQVLVNLLDNAVKFSPDGSSIRVLAALQAETVEVRVCNRGKGILEEDLERIFDRFYRSRDVRERSIPGTGLGLAICKGIIEAHGGHILAQSSPGEETIILFRLPLTAVLQTRAA